MYVALEDILFLIGKGDFSRAREQVDTLLGKEDVVKSDHLYSLAKCIAFWAYRVKNPVVGEQGFLYLLSQWKVFQTFCEENWIFLEENLSLFARGVFALCQDFFAEKKESISKEFWSDMVQVLLSSKEYVAAKGILQEQLRTTPRDVYTLQLLSLVCYKLDNVSLAKLYLSYAFLFDALQVDISLILIPEVVRVKLNLMQSGFREEELLLWIPVYASIRGVFLPKKLSLTESKFVLQTIKKMEENCNKGNFSTMQPILLYYYLFALHHFCLTKQDAYVSKILRRIKYSNEKIYQEVMNITLKGKTLSPLESTR